MADIQSRVQKLLVMAQQDASPNERDIARGLLEQIGEWPRPIGQSSPRPIPHDPEELRQWRSDADRVFGLRTERRSVDGPF